MTSTPNTEMPSSEIGGQAVHEATNISHSTVTKFADDTLGVETQVLSPDQLDSKFVSSISTPESTSIISYLERPTVVNQGSLTTGDTGVIYTFTPTQILSSYKVSRIQFIYSMRFDMKVTLQVNATRFQAGRYILAWIPTSGSTAGSDAENAWIAARRAHLTTITQLPHVEIDLSKETTVTLNVPFTFIWPTVEWSQTGQFLEQLGTFILCPYVPVIAGSGTTTCQYTIWGSFQNIKLTTVSVNQMAPISQKEANAQNIGPISGVLARVSKASTVLGELPIIGTFATQVSWVSDVLARSARVMGWSKPINLAAPNRVVRNVNAFSAVSDVASTAKPLGVMAENSVVPHSGISTTSVDEMSIDFIKQQYAYYTTFNWTTSSTSGTVLISIPVTPKSFVNSWSKGYVCTPVAFLASIFDYFRGGLKFRFKLVKTEFQRGRLVVAFSPTATSSTFTLANSEIVYREIVDISTTSEFEVCVPYLLARPWLVQGGTIGTLNVFVMNVLEAPSSVSTTIPIIVEVCGDSDFEVAVPADNAWEPYSPSTFQMADPYVVTPCFKLGPTSVDVDVTPHTMGEKITSLRQLIKRQTGVRPNGWTPAIGNSYNLSIKPYSFWWVKQAAGTAGALDRGTQYSDLINLFQACYGMSTGSMRYIVSVPPNSNINVYSKARSNSSLAQIGVYSGNQFYWDTTFTPIPVEGIVDLQAPVWQPGLARSTVWQTESTGSSAYAATAGLANTTSLFLSGDGTVSYNVNLYRYAGDDYSLFRWIGVPPIVFTSAT